MQTMENGSFLYLTVHTTMRAGRQEEERPLQSQRGTAGVAVGLVNSTSLLFAFSSLYYIKNTLANPNRQTGLVRFHSSTQFHFLL